VLSSGVDKPVTKKMCFCAEVGLSGEIRPVNRIENRIREAARLGFTSIMLSGAYERINMPTGKEAIKVVKVNRVEEAVKLLFKE